ncbi:MAG: HAD hydrolase-like protein [Zoogloeaceae bacterium]|nr:HAD hydrolase-like protein [Zoogloeaceae bacterium]
MYSTIIYDLDGTLVDSAATVTALLNGLRSEQALPPLTQAEITPWLSIGGRALVAASLGIPEEDSQPFLETFRTRYNMLPCSPEVLYPNVCETLTSLVETGVRLALCTNKPRHLTDKVLSETGLRHFFSTICAGSDLPTCKPHPDNLHACLNVLDSCPAEAIFVGDSRVDQTMAQACGVDFAFYQGGYDDGVEPDHCTLILRQHTEILNLFSSIEQRPRHE